MSGKQLMEHPETPTVETHSWAEADLFEVTSVMTGPPNYLSYTRNPLQTMWPDLMYCMVISQLGN